MAREALAAATHLRSGRALDYLSDLGSVLRSAGTGEALELAQAEMSAQATLKLA